MQLTIFKFCQGKMSQDSENKEWVHHYAFHANVVWDTARLLEITTSVLQQ